MKVLLTLLMFLGMAGAQQPCDLPINDAAGVLRDTLAVQQAADALKQQGADVRVVTVNLSGTLEQFVAQQKRTCSSWQSTDGGVKNNLVVFALAPVQRKFGIFYGAEWKEALDKSQNTIKMQFMAPAFRDGDWARGIAAGERQVGVEIRALQEAALHPAQNTVVNQASDLTGLWRILGWLLLIACLAGLVWVWVRRVQGRQEVATAQQAAQKAAATLAERIQQLRTRYAEQKALGTDVSRLEDTLDDVATTYANLGTSYDPSVKGRGLSDYQEMRRMFVELRMRLVPTAGSASVDKPRRSYASTKEGHTAHPPVSNAEARRTYARAFSPATHSTTIINNGGGTNYVPVPIIVEEPAYRRSSSSSNYGGSSYSSDYGSSSSSSDFGGSSSDYSSSSSDFGGSSSDF